MKMDDIHMQTLKKFHALKGKTFRGANQIRNVPPDRYVDEIHILHDLVRGFYKPAQKPYVLSYRSAESDSVDNYGFQIKWNNKDDLTYNYIEAYPPNKPGDVRRHGDIKAVRYNMHNNIPLGLLFKVEDRVNTILGLGIVTEEREDGVFIIEPYNRFILERLY